jgi:hypothetical protein
MKSDLPDILSLAGRQYLQGTLSREAFLSKVAFHINTYPLDDDDISWLASAFTGEQK